MGHALNRMEFVKDNSSSMKSLDYEMTQQKHVHVQQQNKVVKFKIEQKIAFIL